MGPNYRTLTHKCEDHYKHLIYIGVSTSIVMLLGELRGVQQEQKGMV